MQGPIIEGQVVRLKAKAADNYGLDRTESYRVLRTYTKDGYKALWVELEGGSMVAPFNKVKASEVRNSCDACDPASNYTDDLCDKG